ncbi:hypothetical protein [Sphingomonas suaedae]|uniref:hypothetical protein n=1 Tax=Sphingomonas suaedae TaxID=2599297 RepID=UPI001646E0A7|nr:hypothetical protein [Sphingomonas suaedae]
MSYTPGTLISIAYIDPWGITPPGTFQTGAVAKTSGNPAGLVLAGAIVVGSTPIASAIGAANNMVRVVPAAPLSAGQGYQMWLQWVPVGTSPAQLVWPSNPMLACTMVLPIPTIASMDVAAGSVAGTWTFGSGAGGVSGANLQIFDSGGQSAGYIQAGGNSGSKNITLSSAKTYNAYIQSVQPAYPQTQGGFTAPFAYGPWSPPIPVASASPTITSLGYDGNTLSVGWSAVAVPSAPGPSSVAYGFDVLVDGASVGSYAAGASGGVAAIGALAPGASVSVAARVSFGPVRGPLGTAAAAITLAPAVASTSVTPSGGDVTVAATLAVPTGLPGGASLAVTLLRDGAAVATATASGTPPTATLTTTPVAGAAYAVAAQAGLAGPPAIEGPVSPAVPVVVAAPGTPAIDYDGALLSVSWAPAPDPSVRGYRASITAGGATTVIAGSGTAVTLPMALAPGAAVSATVEALGAAGTGLASQASYSVPSPAAPLLGPARVEGTTAMLQWEPSAGGFVDGYQVTLTGAAPGGGNATATLFTTATAIATPLPIDDIARSWSAQVVPTVNGAAVPAAAASTVLLTAVPVLEGASLALADSVVTATVAWSLADFATNMDLSAAQLRVRVLDGDDIVATQTASFTGTSGSVAVPLPATLPARPALSAQLVSDTLLGPAGTPLALPAVAPTGLVAVWDGVLLTLEWNGGGSGVTGHRVTLTPSSGDPASFTTGPDTFLQADLGLPWGPSWTAMVQPIGDSATGLVSATAQVSLPQVTAPTISLTRVDGNRVELAWSSAGKGPISYRVDLSADGNAIASQQAGQSLSATLELDAPPPVGATLIVTAIVGHSDGPASAPAPVQGAVPAISSASVDAARAVSLSWSVAGGATVTAIGPVAVWQGGMLALPAAGGTSPTKFTLPAGVPNGAAIMLRAVDGVATGAASAGAVLPTLAPSGLAIAYDGALIHARWDASPDGFVSGYAATLRVTGQTPATTPYTAPEAVIAYTPPQDPANAVATLEIAPVAGTSTGPAGTALTVITGTPQLTAATFDGGAVTLQWTPAGGAATATLATLLNGGGAASSAQFEGDTGSFASAPGALAVTLQGVATGSAGPVSTPLALIAAAPEIQSIEFAADGRCTVTWTTVAGAGSYRFALLRSGGSVAIDPVTAQSGATMSTVLPAGTFDPQYGYSLAIGANATASGCALTGPLGVALPVIARAPQGVSLRFDGATVTLVWAAVPDAGVIGYRVSLLSGGTATILGEVSEPYAALPVTGWAADDSILVQAVAAQPQSAAALVLGPAAKVPLTSLGLFLSAGDTAPYIAPAQVAPIAPSDVVILLPDLFPSVPDPIPDVAPFALALIGDAPQGSWQPGLWYKLTLASGSAAWDFPAGDPAPIRTTLLTAYRGFLTALQQAGASPVSIATVQEAIARAMPQTFAETLLYSYGADFARGCFDLRPGMVLRAEYESYQSLGAVPDSQYLSGFVTTGVAEYAISSYSNGGNWLVGLDAFLAGLTAANGVNVNPVPPSQGKAYGGGGILDLFFTQFAQPFVRLVYAQDLLANNSTGSAILQRNPVLIAATSLTDLEGATDALRLGDPPGGAVASVYLRGRVAFSAAIEVFVDGVGERVAIGTTLGNLLAARASRPPIAGLPLTGVRLTRPTGTAILAGGTTGSYGPGEGLDVRFDWTGGHAYAPTSDWLDLPLLHGDRIVLADAIA